MKHVIVVILLGFTFCLSFRKSKSKKYTSHCAIFTYSKSVLVFKIHYIGSLGGLNSNISHLQLFCEIQDFNNMRALKVRT